MSELVTIGIGGPGCGAWIAPTGMIYFLEEDLAGLAAMSAADLGKIAGPRGQEIVEVDGRRIAMRRAQWLFDLAERADAHPALRPLWHAARRLMRETAETGLRRWIEQARERAKTRAPARP